MGCAMDIKQHQEIVINDFKSDVMLEWLNQFGDLEVRHQEDFFCGSMSVQLPDQ